jgi:xylulokinase
MIINDKGSSIGTASAFYDVAQPRPNWSEQDPNDWINACKSVFTELAKAYPSEWSELRAISFSGHMHGATPVDKNGTPIRPCILWNDMRAKKQAATLDAQPNFRAISGNIVFPGFTAPKMKWVADEEPENFANTHKVLLPKDFLTFWLTKTFATEMSDAAGTSWLDCETRSWSDELLVASGMSAKKMPTLHEGSDTVGLIDADIARQFNIPTETKIIAGGADNAIAALGVGAVAEGDGFVSLGTSGVLLAAKNEYAPMPSTAVHTFCHALPDRWYQMGVALSATNSLNWLASVTGKDPAELSSLCTGPVTGPSAVLFLPYLSGERTPHNSAEISGMFAGLRTSTTLADMVQAVMEGVCFAQRDCLEALKSTGTNLTEILAIGGGTKSRFWVETLASILNLRLAMPAQGDFGAALGAARLAAIGDGHSVASILVKPQIEETIVPNENLLAEYEATYAKYKTLYAAANITTA